MPSGRTIAARPVPALRDKRRRSLNVGRRGSLAFERFFRGGRAIGAVGKPGNADAHEADFAGVDAHTRGDADNREAAGRLRHLLVARAGARIVNGHNHFAKNFAGFERGGERVNKKFGGAHGALRLCPLENELRFERLQRSRIIRRGIGVRHTAPDSAHVAHLHVADSGCRFGEQRAFLPQQR